MVPNSDGGGMEGFKEDYLVNVTANGFKDYNGNDAALFISTSRKALLEDKNSCVEKQEKLNFFLRLNILRFSSDGILPSASSKFWKIAEERDEITQSVTSSPSQGFLQRFHGIATKKIDWVSLWNICKNWIKNPLNMALFLWITCVTVSGAVLFLVMTGMLNSALPKKSQRSAWFEVNNQILNALFTLMCLYQHPKRFHHLVLLCRWRPKDITTLRKIYCKNGTCKPHEWAHMMVVVVLLHINCFAQYALSSLNFAYKLSERPAVVAGICFSIALGAPAIAGVYYIISPLGRDYNSESEVDEEAHYKALTTDANLSSDNEERIIEYAPAWRGGLFDVWDNIAIAYLSLFCSFCMFGWNMERLGFGNMYVHVTTFLLFCITPFCILNLAALNIDNESVRHALGLTGIVLSIFGPLYGGFWRIKMRKRFNLPANNSCFGKPDVADCTHWLFCCWCSLAQEVRTADFYDVVENNFCRKQTCENSASPSRDYYDTGRQLPGVEDEFSAKVGISFVKPPVLSSIQREEELTNQNT